MHKIYALIKVSNSLETNKSCSYPNCDLPVNAPHDNNLCFGHAPLENKGMSNEQFDRKLREEKVYKNDFNFDGFIFPSCLTFPNEREVRGNGITLSNCKFFGAQEIKIDGEINKLSIDFYSIRFNTPIRIENSEILHDGRIDFANFNHSLLMEKVDFKGKLFGKKVSCKEKFTIDKCLFNEEVNFPDATFEKEAFINECEFSKKVSFYRSSFKSKVNFDGTDFKDDLILREVKIKGDASFQGIDFRGNTNFNGSEFSDFAKFHKSTFHNNVSFRGSSFNSKLFLTKIVVEASINLSGCPSVKELNASESDFTKMDMSDTVCSGLVEFTDSGFYDETKFDRTIFLKSVDFSRAAFMGIPESNGISFHFTEFKDHIVLDNNRVETRIIFDNITQSDKTTFYFTKPLFNDNGICIFKNIQFEPFTSYFEYIKYDSLRPLLIFRYCNLKDVFFSNNNLSLFSFYKSAFDEARFILPIWENVKEKVLLFTYARKNIIYEDHHFNRAKKSEAISDISAPQRLFLEDLDDLDEIASLYRRFKTALDKTKDYEQAGWFYFNELEMKRKKYAKEQGLKSKFKLWIYWLYKIFAGYGEKPFWSFIWFLVFTVVFSILNFFGGFSYKGKTINYNLLINQNSLNHFNFHWINDWFLSVVYSFLRLIPFNYSPFTRNDFLPIGLDSIFLSFINSIILLTFATFIGIGLKRIFRRF